MSALPSAQVGSFEWLQQTSGIIESRRERWRFMRGLCLEVSPLIVNQARAFLWKRKEPGKGPTPKLPDLPMSTLVDDAVAM